MRNVPSVPSSRPAASAVRNVGKIPSGNFRERGNPLVFVGGVFASVAVAGLAFLILSGGTDGPSGTPKPGIPEYQCTEPTCVKKRDKVVVSYTGTLKDGRIFESSSDGGRMGGSIVEVGGGGPPPGFHRAIANMRQGETKTFTVKAVDAYGPKNLTVEFTKEAFGKDLGSLKEGDEYEFTPGMKVKIVEIGDKTVTAEQPSTHPLAGEDLTYEVKIEQILGSTSDVKTTVPQPVIVGADAGSAKISDGPPPAREETP